ncbi:uncharacterized protein LOC120611714 isoform X2 [Pteropus medius]|uniref:uncharacterized protein LOC120611714 isoform X2 n=1 Tax=Pteropus vampyrus TaxID=132908 RepID=UPI00196B01EB|nr:uncharacterized protein LOC120611714 isoform X2 [Pteropus giganteus]
MPEEVTYATLKFPNSSKTKNLQESCSLKRTDNHEVPELELDGVAENGTGRAESIAEVAENKAVRGRTVSWKVWSLVVFILLSLNLVVLAGLGTLVLMNLTFCSCSVSWIRHGDSGKPHSSKINMNNQKNENRTQLHIRCLPSSVSWMNLNCTPNKTIMKAKNLSNFCILTCAETVT